MSKDFKICRKRKIFLPVLLSVFFFFYFDAAFAQNKCNVSLPFVRFQSGIVKLTNSAKTQLSESARKLQANPSCIVMVRSYPSSSKSSQSMCSKRMEAIKLFLIEVGNISADRIFTECKLGEGGDPNIADLLTDSRY
jgi:hypothetical protein